VAEARGRAVDISKVATEYRAREDVFRRVQSLLNTVMDGLERMKLATAMALPTVSIAQLASLPEDPSEPRLPIYIPSAIIFSLLLGMGLCLLLELMDTRLRTPIQIVRQVGVPLLSNVPDLTEDERLALDMNVALVSQKAPQSLLAEAFRQLRTSLLFSSERPVKSILVTSPNPGDGKSTVAANLAITMARSGASVLLIEANFRRPSLARTFDVPASVGLSNVLVGLSSAAEAIQATAIENLDLLTCGALPPSPAELLGSDSMRQLMTEQARAYDHVIIDGAPILVVADNHLLAEVVDGIILVFRAGENTRGIALRAAAQMKSLRGRLLGAVLNRVRATKGGYFRESFQAYYDYAGASCPVDVKSGTPTAALVRPRLLNGNGIHSANGINGGNGGRTANGASVFAEDEPKQ
jgi:capsular exopolysaccharide synthesis family protein